MGDRALLLWKKHGCNLAYWLWIFLCNVRVITSLNNIRFVLESLLQRSSGWGSVPRSGERPGGSLLNEYHHPWHSMGLKFYVPQKLWKRWSSRPQQVFRRVFYVSDMQKNFWFSISVTLQIPSETILIRSALWRVCTITEPTVCGTCPVMENLAKLTFWR